MRARAMRSSLGQGTLDRRGEVPASDGPLPTCGGSPPNALRSGPGAGAVVQRQAAVLPSTWSTDDVACSGMYVHPFDHGLHHSMPSPEGLAGADSTTPQEPDHELQTEEQSEASAAPGQHTEDEDSDRSQQCQFTEEELISLRRLAARHQKPPLFEALSPQGVRVALALLLLCCAVGAQFLTSRDWSASHDGAEPFAGEPLHVWRTASSTLVGCLDLPKCA